VHVLGFEPRHQENSAHLLTTATHARLCCIKDKYYKYIKIVAMYRKLTSIYTQVAISIGSSGLIMPDIFFF
jgi:hypothetical protein